MPIDDNVVLNEGDVLQVSGDARRVRTIADRIGFISFTARSLTCWHSAPSLLLG
ncbi:hypothetical protein ACVXG9_04750 [Escherichia coli]